MREEEGRKPGNLSLDFWRPSNIRQEEEDEARRNKQRDEQRLNNKEKPKEEKGLRRLIFIMSDALEFEKDEN